MGGGLVGDLSRLGVLGGCVFGGPTQVGLLACSRFGALACLGSGLGIGDRLSARGVERLGQCGQPGLDLAAFAVGASKRLCVLASLRFGLRSGGQRLGGTFGLSAGFLFGFRAGGRRLGGTFSLLAGGTLCGKARPVLGPGLLFGLSTPSSCCLSGLGVRQCGPLRAFPFGRVGQCRFLGRAAALGELGRCAFGNRPGLVGGGRRGGMLSSQFVSSLAGPCGSFGGLFRCQAVGGLLRGGFLGGTAQMSRALGGPGMLQ